MVGHDSPFIIPRESFVEVFNAADTVDGRARCGRACGLSFSPYCHMISPDPLRFDGDCTTPDDWACCSVSFTGSDVLSLVPSTDLAPVPFLVFNVEDYVLNEYISPAFDRVDGVSSFNRRLLMAKREDQEKFDRMHKCIHTRVGER
ncbi:hypothetical protein B296_00023613 [Ensete ventricosum]|uniref:Uncharacterized protein n=1 Tax=Ensete ventricosum TaxID=4639 RepID=A0A427AW92_ENSVE|nr:hypothetical protein B296_00023613 [Ensete ventricosum]